MIDLYQIAYDALRDAEGDLTYENALIMVSVRPRLAKAVMELLEATIEQHRGEAAAEALRLAAINPDLRLSGHSGIGVRQLQSLADEIAAGIQS